MSPKWSGTRVFDFVTKMWGVWKFVKFAAVMSMDGTYTIDTLYVLCCVYLALGTYITLKFKICRNRFVKTIKKSSVIFNCLWWVYFEACLKWKLINIGIVTTSCAEWLKGNSRANEVSLFVVNPIFGIGVLWEKIGDLRCGNLPSGLGKNSNNFGQSWGTGHG